MIDDEQVSILYDLMAAQLKGIKSQLPPGYKPEDSEIIRRGGLFAHDVRRDVDHPSPDDRPWSQRAQQMRERQERINAARNSQAHVLQLQAERDRRIQELMQSGNLTFAEALRTVLADIKAAADAGLNWLSDHLDLEHGRLKLGRYEANGMTCDVFIKVGMGPPSIKLETECVF